MPQEITIVKSSGLKEPFLRDKIIQSALRVGVSRDIAGKVADRVESKVYPGIESHEINNIVLAELDKNNSIYKFIYNLPRAVAQIEPYNFEVYTKKVLEAHGFTCQWNVLIKGASVEHQIDIVAEKNGEKSLVECKHHYDYHKLSGLGCVLQVQARLEDVRDGFAGGINIHNFKYAWLINNTKFSEHAKTYATAKKIKLSGWHYTGDESLERLVESKLIYPLGIFDLNRHSVNRLADQGVITIQDALANEAKLEEVLGQNQTKNVMRWSNDILGYKHSN